MAKSDDREIRTRRYKKHQWLKGLGCFSGIHRMMTEGVPMGQIVDFMIEEGEIDKKTEKVLTALKRYRDDIPPGQMLAPYVPKKVYEANKKFDEALSQLELLGKLYAKREQVLDLRIEDEVQARESGSNIERLDILMKSVDRATSELRDTIMSIHNIKMDLDLGEGRNLGTVKIEDGVIERVSKQYGPDVATALQSPESRGKVFAAIQQLSVVVDKTKLDEN